MLELIKDRHFYTTTSNQIQNQRRFLGSTTSVRLRMAKICPKFFRQKKLFGSHWIAAQRCFTCIPAMIRWARI